MTILQDLKQQYRIGDMTIKLIFWNVLLFVVPSIVFGILQLFKIAIPYHFWVGLSENAEGLIQKPWSIVSYNFFHSGIMHLVFNMFMLSFAGRLFVTFFTQKQLLGVYLLGGIFGGIIYLLSYLFLPMLSNEKALLVGASASIMATLVAVTTYQPLMNIKVPLIGYIRLFYITITVIIIIDILQFSSENAGKHLAHLGGALFGFIYIKALKSGVDLSSGLNRFLDVVSNVFSPKKSTPFKAVHKTKSAKTEQRASRVVTKDKTQQQIDEILDKISQSGYDSLTKEEKEFLFKTGK